MATTLSPSTSETRTSTQSLILRQRSSRFAGQNPTSSHFLRRPTIPTRESQTSRRRKQTSSGSRSGPSKTAFARPSTTSNAKLMTLEVGSSPLDPKHPSQSLSKWFPKFEERTSGSGGEILRSIHFISSSIFSFLQVGEKHAWKNLNSMETGRCTSFKKKHPLAYAA